jgi:hypothetical protein
MTHKLFVLVVDGVPAGDVTPQGLVPADAAGYQEVSIPPYPQDGRRYVPGNPRFEGDALMADWLQVEDPGYILRTAMRARAERESRDARIKLVEWRYARYERNARLGLPQQDDMAKLDAYVQALADVPSQEGFPWQIDWPVYTP